MLTHFMIWSSSSGKLGLLAHLIDSFRQMAGSDVRGCDVAGDVTGCDVAVTYWVGI